MGTGELEPDPTSEIAVQNEKDITVQEERDGNDKATGLKLDPHGFPLHPQPSSDPRDPLNWNKWFKLWVLFQVSLLSFLSPFTQAVINAAYIPLSKAMHITVQQASYSLTVAIITSGVVPLIWPAISNVYGRRPIFIFVSILGIIGHAASGAAPKWGGILTARAFMGIGTSAGTGIGGAVVADMYFMHQRGRYMGFYVFFLQNGAHIAAVVGGYAAKTFGWRACFWIPTIIWGCNWVVNVFCLPETLYHRNNATGESLQPQNEPWIKRFTFNSAAVGRGKLRLRDFTHVFEMLRYPSVFFPTLYYAISFGVGTVLFAVTGASAFSSIYHYDTSQIGLIIGLPTLIGSLLGEFCSGPVSDRILYLYTKRHNGVSKPEARLQAMWPGFIIMPAGVIIEGVCLQYHTHWMGPAMGMALGLFGLQIVSTNIFAYVADCYKPQSSELSTLLNFGRQTFSFTLGFYMIPFAKETTYGVAWSVMALINMSLFAGIILLMFKGEKWRERLGPPNFDRDL
ncbi:MFS general substrate transporter [Rhizodiscina lignyota]|uniref:MFS general substrate transporter n=1 Tax=Rhizodiscina lignyota TaxID=1504668 RepID=A0A9P4MF07_9PEZI|nr:MFS general substrate transporter [Rhizodiscina lignyota]